MREEAIELQDELEHAASVFMLDFDDAELTTKYYTKSEGGKYSEATVWLVPYKQAEQRHVEIVQPLLLEIALLKAKIEAYELGKGEEC